MFYLDISIQSTNLYLKSSVGEGILSSFSKPNRASQMHSRVFIQTHTMRGRIAARHLLSCRGDSETAGERKALTSKYVSEQWQLTKLEVTSI